MAESFDHTRKQVTQRKSNKDSDVEEKMGRQPEREEKGTTSVTSGDGRGKEMLTARTEEGVAAEAGGGNMDEHSSGVEEEADESETTVSSDNDGMSARSRLPGRHKTPGETGARTDYVQGTTESASVLPQVLDTMNNITQALNTLQTSSNECVQEVKNLASTMASDTKHMHSLLETLIQEIRKLSSAKSADCKERASSEVSQSPCDHVVVNCVHPDPSDKESQYTMAVKKDDDTNQLSILLQTKMVQPDVQAIERFEQSQHLDQKYSRNYGPEHLNDKPLDQFAYGTIRHWRPGALSEPESRGSGRESGYGSANSAAACTKQAKEMSKSNIPEEGVHHQPFDTPTNRTHASSSRARDARPKETTHSDRRGSHRNPGIRSMNIRVHGGDTESRRLQEAVDQARAPVLNPPPKAKSYDTVLCLDTSESMLQGNARQQMIDTAMAFINGVEDMASEVEENIGLVTFGGRARIALPLTIDFSLARDTVDRLEFGGSSPFFEATVVCLSAFHGKGGTVSISGEYDIHPRIIFITDGHITESNDDLSDRVNDATNTKASFSRLMMDLNPKKDPSLPHPIVFVPVGSRADQRFLKSMSELNSGQLVQPGDIHSLCRYFRIQETIGKVIVCMHTTDDQNRSRENIKALVKAFAPSTNEQDMDEVTSAVFKELDSPSKLKHHTDRMGFDDVFEDADGVASYERLPLGTRVMRGPDWKWGDQDNGGPGTVIQHEQKKHGFTWVLWDDGHRNRYPYGSEMGYHILETEGNPVPRARDGNLKIGMLVKKGPNWKEPQTRYSGDLGVIIRVSSDGKQLKVRWKNGVIQACPVSAVEFSDPFEQDIGSKRHDKETIRQTQPEEEEEDEGDKIPVWQWRDNWGLWRLYPKDLMSRMEAEYQRRKNGTCVFWHGDRQVRVLFQRRTEKDIERKVERDIQRVLLSEEDLRSLEVAEKLVSSD
ncbi:uncharacterized protein LOC143298902 [Babylonia areolata]|uniref:uncharacterized protein LOC143298902 n=1 Tax=Babylonia areolata TaxID=304850 RepID=UPI003FD2465D